MSVSGRPVRSKQERREETTTTYHLAHVELADLDPTVDERGRVALVEGALEDVLGRLAERGREGVGPLEVERHGRRAKGPGKRERRGKGVIARERPRIEGEAPSEGLKGRATGPFVPWRRDEQVKEEQPAAAHDHAPARHQPSFAERTERGARLGLGGQLRRKFQPSWSESLTRRCDMLPGW